MNGVVCPERLLLGELGGTAGKVVVDVDQIELGEEHVKPAFRHGVLPSVDAAEPYGLSECRPSFQRDDRGGIEIGDQRRCSTTRSETDPVDLSGRGRLRRRCFAGVTSPSRTSRSMVRSPSIGTTRAIARPRSVTTTCSHDDASEGWADGQNDSVSDFDIEDFLRLETEVWGALVGGDARADARLLSKDFLGVYPSGFADRSGHVGQLDDGPTVAEFELSEERLLALSDSVVLLSYRAAFRRPGSEEASEPEVMYVSSLWCHRNGRWVNVFSQDTPSSAAPSTSS
jgi:hypothetical protein